MRIERFKPEEQRFALTSLAPGGVFHFPGSGNYYIAGDRDGEHRQATNLSDGNQARFLLTALVIPVTAKVVVEEL